MLLSWPHRQLAQRTADNCFHQEMPPEVVAGPAAVAAGKRSKMWATINEPGVHAMCGYIAGNHPPGRIAHFKVPPYPKSYPPPGLSAAAPAHPPPRHLKFFTILISGIYAR